MANVKDLKEIPSGALTGVTITKHESKKDTFVITHTYQQEITSVYKDQIEASLTKAKEEIEAVDLEAEKAKLEAEHTAKLSEYNAQLSNIAK